METRARAALRGLGRLPPEMDEDGFPEFAAGPPRELAMVFDFVEVAGGAGVVARAVDARDYPAVFYLDLALSPHFDLREDVPLRWFIYMLENRRIGVLFLEPPCTDFSAAKHPASRS